MPNHNFANPHDLTTGLTLITGGNSSLARALVAQLLDQQSLRIVDTAFEVPPPAGTDAHIGDVRDEATAHALLEGVTRIIHLAPLDASGEGEALDTAVRGTYVLLQTARAAGVRHVVLGSSLALFDTLPATYRIDHQWRPRPRPIAAHLAFYLSEVCAREIARAGDIAVCCVRLGAAIAPALEAIVNALQHHEPGWSIVHAAGLRPIIENQQPDGAKRIAAHQPHHVIIFGAGGPLAAATIRELAPNYTLRLADIRPIEAILANNVPQFPGAPMPEPILPPHNWRTVDVTDAAQVHAACQGMDAIINCTVIRREVARAFRVNMLGAYNVVQAAVAHGIKRVVHTGPFQMGQPGAAGYDWDWNVVDDVPARPGSHFAIYFDSKLAGQEICRIFAEQYGLEVAALLFNEFVNPAVPRDSLQAFSVSWRDAARAVRAALETPALPSPFEILHINADLPHGIFPNDKAKRILNWHPHDDLHEFWSDTP